MDIGSIFLLLAIFIPVALYIIRPLIERRMPVTGQAYQDVSHLLAERDQVIAALQELDDDYHLGKIPEEVYPSQRNAMLQSGADILRQIDALQQTITSTTAEDRLEAAIVARRSSFSPNPALSRKNSNAVPPVPDDDLEQLIASRRRLRQGKAGGFCPRCGQPVQAIDHFCPKCGATLS